MTVCLRAKQLLMPGCILFIALCSFALTPHTWVVQTESATIHFEVPGYRHYGDIGGLKCVFTFDPLSPSESSIIASVDVSSITTDKEMLTRHLKSRDYFDVERYPQINFASDSIRKTESGYSAYGKLTMKGITQPVEIPFTFVQTDSVSIAKGDLEVNAGNYKVGKGYRHDRDLVLISIEVPMKYE